MEYKDFTEEMKTYINKALEIYNSIANKEISKIIDNLFYHEKYELCRFDKKIISLFIAGLMCDGETSKLFSNYDDIKLEELLEFIEIDEYDIKPLNTSYEDYFDENMKIDLMSILYKYGKQLDIKFVTPFVILNSLKYASVVSFDILQKYANDYLSGNESFYKHPLFYAIENMLDIEGSLNKENPKALNPFSFFFGFPNGNENDEEEDDTKEDDNTKLIKEDSLWDNLEEIKRKFIGQENAVEDLFYNIVNNQNIVNLENFEDGMRSIIFLDGPTGTGKTAIIREIADKINVPCVSTSITKYSTTGYVGDDLEDLLVRLLKKAGNDVEKAQKGILVLDEFDKIICSENYGLQMKKAVQQDLLDFLGGGKYNVSISSSPFGRSSVEFDTSKLTFICLGALTDLRVKKQIKDTIMGFMDQYEVKNENSYSITPDDLIKEGFERELVGRLNTYIHTDDYNKEKLLKILKESTISPIVGLKIWIESQGKQLVINDETLDAIAEEAYKLNTGARSLQTIVNNIRTSLLKEVLRGENEFIYLTKDIITKESDKVRIRKGRM